MQNEMSRLQILGEALTEHGTGIVLAELDGENQLIRFTHQRHVARQA